MTDEEHDEEQGRMVEATTISENETSSSGALVDARRSEGESTRELGEVSTVTSDLVVDNGSAIPSDDDDDDSEEGGDTFVRI